MDRKSTNWICHERWGRGLKCRGNGSFNNNNIKQRRTKTTPKGKNKQAGRRLEHSQTRNSHVTKDTRKTTDQHRTADTSGAFPLHGTARYGTVHFWGVFHWVLYLVPDTFLVPLRSRFHASRTVTKTWRVNSADHWLAGENRHYCVTELATRDPPLQPLPARFKSAQPAKDRTQLLFKQTHIFASTTK